MRTGLLLFLAMTTACAPVPAPNTAQPTPGEPYRGYGTEPFWSVSIGPEEMRFEAPDRQAVTVRTPEPRTTPDGRRYQTERLSIDIVRKSCSDGMSDKQFGEQVTVAVDGKAYQGCGGPPLPPATLAGTSWRIVEIDGVAATGSRPPGISFEAARVSGSSGCNRFTGGYRIEGSQLIPGALATSRMACIGPAMDTEMRLFAVLNGPMTIGYRPDGRMTLTAGDGRVILLERSE